MRIRLSALLLLCLTFCVALFFKPPKSYTFTPFVQAHCPDELAPPLQLEFHDRLKKKKWRRIQRLYQTYLEGKKRAYRKEKIPKIIHQIWLDGPLPENYQAVQKSWLKHHPQWEYHLWTKDEVRYLYLQNQDLFDNGPKEKQVEILRYEILHQFGGVIVDINYECLQPFDPLHHHCDFYVGLEQNLHSPIISSAIVGAIPGHPLIKHCIRKLRKPSLKYPQPLAFTHSFSKILKKSPKLANLILPAAFFHPKDSRNPSTFATPHSIKEGAN